MYCGSILLTAPSPRLNVSPPVTYHTSIRTVFQADECAPVGDALEEAVIGQVTESQTASVAQAGEQTKTTEIDAALTAIAEEQTPEPVGDTSSPDETGIDEAGQSAALTPEQQPPAASAVSVVSAEEEPEEIVDLPFGAERKESTTAPTGDKAAAAEEKEAITQEEEEEEAVGAEKAPKLPPPSPSQPAVASVATTALSATRESSSPSAVEDVVPVPEVDGRQMPSSTADKQEEPKAPAAVVAEEVCGLLGGAAAAAAAATSESEPASTNVREATEVEGTQQAGGAMDEEAVIGDVIEVSFNEQQTLTYIARARRSPLSGLSSTLVTSFALRPEKACTLLIIVFSTVSIFFQLLSLSPLERSLPSFQQPGQQDTDGVLPEQPAAAATAAVTVMDDPPIDSVPNAAELEEEDVVAEEDGPQAPPLEVDETTFAAVATDDEPTTTVAGTGINARSAGTQAVVRDDEATTTAAPEEPMPPADTGEMLPAGSEETPDADDAPAVVGVAAAAQMETPLEEEDTDTTASAAPAVVPDESASTVVSEISEGDDGAGAVADVAGETSTDEAVEVSRQWQMVSGHEIAG